MKLKFKVIFLVLLFFAVVGQQALISQGQQKKPRSLTPVPEPKKFTMVKTYPDCGTVKYEGRTYHTVQIGSQCWLRENLDVGQSIDRNLNQTDNGKVEKYAPWGDPGLFPQYGGLYQWMEAMRYRIAEPAPGICPPGFHIPSEVEWYTLIDFLGGETVAGGKMKEAGFVFWDERNTGATNESGFSARAAGIRDYNSGLAAFREEAWFWTNFGSQNDKAARCLVLRSDSNGVAWKTIKWTTGLSVRCLR